MSFRKVLRSPGMTGYGKTRERCASEQCRGGCPRPDRRRRGSGIAGERDARLQTEGRSRNDTLKDLAEAAACFANARGGVVIVGVADKIAGPAAIVGTDLDATDLAILRALGVLSPHGTLTNAGALLLTDQVSESDQIAYTFRRTPAGRLVTNEHLRTPLLTSLLRVLDLIEARVDRTPVNLPRGQQVLIADLPEAAVREAIVNAVMHRDYRRPAAISVEHSATRLLVESPGPFVTGVTVHNVLTASSRTRNQALANAIRELGLAEPAGTGVDRMYAEISRIGRQPPEYEADESRVRLTLLGGAPNAHLARFVASLPPEEAAGADTMLVLVTLLGRRTTTAATMAPVLQKSVAETQTVMDRIGSESVQLVERTRESAREQFPTRRLLEHAIAELGPALANKQRSADQYDRNVIVIVRETGTVNARLVKLTLDLDAVTASRLLGDLVDRGILVKTSKAQRGPSVAYGPGPRFPRRATRRPPKETP